MKRMEAHFPTSAPEISRGDSQRQNIDLLLEYEDEGKPPLTGGGRRSLPTHSNRCHSFSTEEPIRKRFFPTVTFEGEHAYSLRL